MWSDLHIHVHIRVKLYLMKMLLRKSVCRKMDNGSLLLPDVFTRFIIMRISHWPFLSLLCPETPQMDLLGHGFRGSAVSENCAGVQSWASRRIPVGTWCTSNRSSITMGTQAPAICNCQASPPLRSYFPSLWQDLLKPQTNLDTFLTAWMMAEAFQMTFWHTGLPYAAHCTWNGLVFLTFFQRGVFCTYIVCAWCLKVCSY